MRAAALFVLALVAACSTGPNGSVEIDGCAPGFTAACNASPPDTDAGLYSGEYPEVCVDLRTDWRNCGTCGALCGIHYSDGSSSAGTCIGGVCIKDGGS